MKSFRELQESNGIIPEENGFYQYPECYKFIDEDESECLFLEDLRESNCEMIDIRNKAITIEVARLVLSTLGRFHALSFALKDKQPAKFKKFAEQIPEIFLIDRKTGLVEYMETYKPLIYGVVNEDEDDIRKKLDNLFEKSVFDATKKFVNGADAEPYAVICHGDCWSNNFLYQFDEVNKI